MGGSWGAHRGGDGDAEDADQADRVGAVAGFVEDPVGAQLTRPELALLQWAGDRYDADRRMAVVWSGGQGAPDWRPCEPPRTACPTPRRH